MSKLIAIHSYRGGTGKTNLTANIAAILANLDKRVGIIDADIQNPGIHVLFGFDEDSISCSVNDYLWGRCEIRDTNYDVTSVLKNPAKESQMYLFPCSMCPKEIGLILREGYDIRLLEKGFKDLVDNFNLDYLLIDIHPGLNEEILLSIAISDILVMVLRPDQQNFQGTAVTVDLAQKLKVPEIFLVMNKVLKSLDTGDLRQQVESTYGLPVIGMLPLSEDMAALASRGIFSLNYPEHSLCRILETVAQKIVD